MYYKILVIQKSSNPFETMRKFQIMINSNIECGFVPHGSLVIDGDHYIQALIFNGDNNDFPKN
jgi:hypothetical protein